MKTITETMQQNIEKKKMSFIPFIVAGDPDIETSKEIIKTLEQSGADILELGIPYSDPLADGPVIQKASQRALKAGMSLKKSIELVSCLRRDISIPVIMFTYFNPVLKYGLEKLVKDIKKAGFQGLLIPDLPIEEMDDIIELTQKEGIELVMLVTPTSGAERIKKIVDVSQGFVYLVSVTGVTGERTDFSGSVERSLFIIRQYTTKPVAVGFGISKKDHIDKLKHLNAQGAIIGSALIKQIEANLDNKACLLKNIEEYVAGLGL